jgi:hypothetical protein
MPKYWPDGLNGRHNGNTPPLGEAVKSPASMFNSELLELVHSE